MKLKYLFFVLFVLWNVDSYASTKLDSLKNSLLESRGEDKVFLYYEIAEQYMEVNIDSSIWYGKALLSQSQRLNYSFGEALGYFILGTYYDKKGEYLEAIHYQQLALIAFQKEKDSVSIAKTYLNLGIEFQYLGNYEEALRNYQLAEGYGKLLKDSYLSALVFSNIGRLYEDWQRYALALEYYKVALTHAKKSGVKETTELILHNIGVEYNNLKKYKTATKYLDSAMIMCQSLHLREGLFYVYYDYGNSYLGMEKINQAEEMFDQSLELGKELDNRLLISKAFYKLGVIYQKKDQAVKAIDFYENALRLSKEIKENKLTKDILFSLSNISKDHMAYSKALAYYQEYTMIKDSLFEDNSHKMMVDMQVKYETDKKVKEIEIQNLKIEQQESKYFLTLILSVGFFTLFVVIALLFFNRYRYRQRESQTKLEKQNIEIEQRLLRTQMNPHFIFNSLNSISNFIMKNKTTIAQAYLAKFARLMRLILDNSREKMIPLEDEVETLQLYMEQERLRFNEIFDFTIEVEPKIEQEFTYVPPMLVQPFVENAILHGLAPKGEQGNITVSFRVVENLVEVIIVDDGIGRKAALKRKEQRDSKRKSLGMQVTQERLDIFRKETGREVSMQIVDLLDGEKAVGTKVILRIPYEEE